MKNLILIVLLSLGLLMSHQAKAQLTLDSTVVTIDTLITGLNVPWEIHWGQDNWIWMTEREGIVSRINPATGVKDEILDITSTVYAASESGLLGLTLHPQFPDSSYVYIVYTYRPASQILERMARYTYNGTNLVNPQTLIENIPGNTTHDGSRLLIGPDNKLYMTTGDAQNQPSAQDPLALTGKTLRLNLDGSIPTDNPIAGSYVYSWGHRNAQGLCLGPNNLMYSSEHGPNTDDELNIIQAGGNYGWPNVVGFCNTTAEIAFCADSNVIEPLTNFEANRTIAASDLIYYNHPAIPEWQGKLLLSVLKDKQLRVISLDGNGTSVTADVELLTNQYGRLRDVLAGPDGTVYLATNGQNWNNSDPNTHTILRLKNYSYQPTPLMANAGNDTSICIGGTTVLGGLPTASGGMPPYTYQWGSTQPIACDTCSNPAVIITDTVTYSVTVTDGNSATATDAVTINVQPLDIDTPLVPVFEVTILDTTISLTGFPIEIAEVGSQQFEEIHVIYFSDDTLYNVSLPLTDTIDFGCTTDDPVSGCWADIIVCGINQSTCTKICEEITVSINFVYNSVLEPLIHEIKLFPNPTTGLVSIQTNGQPTQVTIINQQGQQVLQQEIKTGSTATSLDLSNQPAGIYFVKVQAGGQQVVKKLILY